MLNGQEVSYNKSVWDRNVVSNLNGHVKITLISKVNGVSGISIKELPEANKQWMAKQGKKVGSWLSQQPYLKGKN